MKTARPARCWGRPAGLAPGPRRTIPGHGAARAHPRSRRCLTKAAMRCGLLPRPHRDLGSCTQVGHTVTIRMTLVVSVRKRGAPVP